MVVSGHLKSVCRLSFFSQGADFREKIILMPYINEDVSAPET